jgi:hypothetical protein
MASFRRICGEIKALHSGIEVPKVDGDSRYVPLLMMTYARDGATSPAGKELGFHKKVKIFIVHRDALTGYGTDAKRARSLRIENDARKLRVNPDADVVHYGTGCPGALRKKEYGQ